MEIHTCALNPAGLAEAQPRGAVVSLINRSNVQSLNGDVTGGIKPGFWSETATVSTYANVVRHGSCLRVKTKLHRVRMENKVSIQLAICDRL